MSEEIKKAYDHREVEEKIYERWMKKGYFTGKHRKKPTPS